MCSYQLTPCDAQTEHSSKADKTTLNTKLKGAQKSQLSSSEFIALVYKLCDTQGVLGKE